jgi:hypothetical protein
VGDCVGLGDAVVLGDAVGVGEDCPPDGTDDAGEEGDAAGDGDAPSVTVGEAVAEVEGELGLARPTAGPKGTKSVDVATTTAASASSPATARIGTTASRRPRGRGSRQFGQKPETGVVT